MNKFFNSDQAGFTNEFYKFLFGFSLIIILSFGVLVFLSNKNAEVDDQIVEPASQTAN